MILISNHANIQTINLFHFAKAQHNNIFHSRDSPSMEDAVSVTINKVKPVIIVSSPSTELSPNLPKM